MGQALALHDRVMRQLIESRRGYVFTTAGDAFSAAFARVDDGVTAAIEAQTTLTTSEWPAGCELRVRMGLHTGEAEERDGDYFGPAMIRAARLMPLGHGGQILVSSSTATVASGVRSAGPGDRRSCGPRTGTGPVGARSSSCSAEPGCSPVGSPSNRPRPSSPRPRAPTCPEPIRILQSNVCAQSSTTSEKPSGSRWTHQHTGWPRGSSPTSATWHRLPWSTIQECGPPSSCRSFHPSALSSATSAPWS
ncbi:MAG: adenylate/guanylate cyclase domain-containing protein [Actinomycetia bacterium]|nr:adenylate/guanylate cyclase domain-containing protein [Actinomycetes bacterium]